MRSALRRAAVVLTSLVLSPTLATPSPAQDAPPPFGELVEVRVVNVEVVVEDGKGKRVHGLEADRFRLLVDGRELPLEHFAEVREGTAVAASVPGEAAADTRSGRDEGAGALPPVAVTAGQAVANSYLIFVDDYFATGAHRNLVLDKLARQLGKIRAPDQAAVVAFGGRELELLSSWSSSRVDLDRALAAAAARPAWGLMRFAERERLGVPQFGGVSSGFFPGLNEYELRREVAALIGAMQSFADAPGRKVLIVLAGGWPSIDTSASSRRNFDRPQDGIEENDLEMLLPVIETANLLGFTIYPIDLPGYRETPRSVPGDESGFDVGWRSAAGNRSETPNLYYLSNATPDTFVYGQRNDSVLSGRGANDLSEIGLHREMLRQSTLRVVARDTGGRALLGSARDDALARVIADTGSYYWLSFTPPEGGDDRPQKIRVEVEGDGYQVRSRRGYRNLSTGSRVAMATLGAALVPEAGGDDELAVTLGVARRAGPGKVEIPVRIEVPLDRLEFLPRDGSLVADLELRLAAIDSIDRHTEMPVVPLGLTRTTPPGAGETSSFETVVTLPRRARSLTVSLFDPVGGKVLLATSEIER